MRYTDGRIIWTEKDVRERLKRYHEDDSLYDCSAVRMSHIKAGHSADDDGVGRRVYRLLKRAELDRAIEQALQLPPGEKIRTKKQADRVRLYYILRLIYVYDMSMATVAFLLRCHRSTVARWEQEAVGLVAGWLNRRKEGA